MVIIHQVKMLTIWNGPKKGMILLLSVKNAKMARPILEGNFGFLTIFLESSLNFGSENMYDMTIVIILKKDVFVQNATFLLVETWMLS